ADWVSSWLCSTIPSFTIATTRSRATPVDDMSRVCAWAAPGNRSVHRRTVAIRLMDSPGGSGSDVPGGGGVSPNAALQESVVPGSDRREPLEFHLEQDRVVALTGSIRDVVAGDQPHAPAAAAVLEAGEGGDRLVLFRRVHLPRVDLPGRREAPGEACVPLLEQPLAVTIAYVGDRLRARPVLQARLAAQRIRVRVVPFHRDARAPVAPGGELDLAHDVGGAALLGELARQQDARALEVEAMADRLS